MELRDQVITKLVMHELADETVKAIDGTLIVEAGEVITEAHLRLARAHKAETRLLRSACRRKWRVNRYDFLLQARGLAGKLKRCGTDAAGCMRDFSDTHKLNYVIGQESAVALHDKENNLLIAPGELITETKARLAQQAGRLEELFLAQQHRMAQLDT